MDLDIIECAPPTRKQAAYYKRLALIEEKHRILKRARGLSPASMLRWSLSLRLIAINRELETR